MNSQNFRFRQIKSKIIILIDLILLISAKTFPRYQAQNISTMQKFNITTSQPYNIITGQPYNSSSNNQGMSNSSQAGYSINQQSYNQPMQQSYQQNNNQQHLSVMTQQSAQIQSLPSQNFSTYSNPEFTLSVDKLLRVELKKFQLNIKQIAFKKFEESLTPDDKKLEMRYIRCINNVDFPQINCKEVLQRLKSITISETGYDYPYSNEWYVNFADQELFGFYNLHLYAQDEIQVLEHPLLARVLEQSILLAKTNLNLAPKLQNSENIPSYGNQKYNNNQLQIKPTPILITNAQRLGEIDISNGNNKLYYYGNNFEKIPPKEFENRIKVFGENKTVSHIIAMAAMAYQKGFYTHEQIAYTFENAYKSFRNAVLVSQQMKQTKQCVINTGNWGTGAFGNDKVLIAIIQILSALIAEVDYMSYHTFNKEGTQAFQEGMKRVEKILSSAQTLSIKDIIDKIYDMKFKWGTSNGS